MKLFLDTADLDQIKEANKMGVIAGRNDKSIHYCRIRTFL